MKFYVGFCFADGSPIPLPDDKHGPGKHQMRREMGALRYGPEEQRGRTRLQILLENIRDRRFSAKIEEIPVKVDELTKLQAENSLDPCRIMDSIIYLEKCFPRQREEEAAKIEAGKLRGWLNGKRDYFMHKLDMAPEQYDYHISHTPFAVAWNKELANDPKPPGYAAALARPAEEKKGPPRF